MNGYLILGWLFLIIGLCCWINVFYSIYLLLRTRLVVTLPLNQKIKKFTITKKGGYAIWEEGPLFNRTPSTSSHPKIINTDFHRIISLSRPWGRVNKNSFTRGANLIFYCELDVGNYCLEVADSSSLNGLEGKISQSLLQHLPIKKASESYYNFQVQESLSKKQRLIMSICIFAGLFFFVRGLFTILHLMLGIPMEGSLA